MKEISIFQLVDKNFNLDYVVSDLPSFFSGEKDFVNFYYFYPGNAKDANSRKLFLVNDFSLNQLNKICKTSYGSKENFEAHVKSLGDRIMKFSKINGFSNVEDVDVIGLQCRNLGTDFGVYNELIEKFRGADLNFNFYRPVENLVRKSQRRSLVNFDALRKDMLGLYFGK